jgi:hypothetical protein
VEPEPASGPSVPRPPPRSTTTRVLGAISKTLLELGHFDSDGASLLSPEPNLGSTSHASGNDNIFFDGDVYDFGSVVPEVLENSAGDSSSLRVEELEGQLELPLEEQEVAHIVQTLQNWLVNGPVLGDSAYSDEEVVERSSNGEVSDEDGELEDRESCSLSTSIDNHKPQQQVLILEWND